MGVDTPYHEPEGSRETSVTSSPSAPLHMGKRLTLWPLLSGGGGCLHVLTIPNTKKHATGFHPQPSADIIMSRLKVPHLSYLLIYADDITIIRAATLAESQHLREPATALAGRMTTWGLTTSPYKSALMCFTLKRQPVPPTVSLNGTPVPNVRIHNFQGLQLDGPRLTWASHIEYL